MNTLLKVMDTSSICGKFALDAEVWYIGNQDIMLCFFWLTENRLLENAQDTMVPKEY